MSNDFKKHEWEEFTNFWLFSLEITSISNLCMHCHAYHMPVVAALLCLWAGAGDVPGFCECPCQGAEWRQLHHQGRLLPSHSQNIALVMRLDSLCNVHNTIYGKKNFNYKFYIYF